MFTNEEKSRLNSMFRNLWGARMGVRGSWGADSHDYHPTYIRRGPLLIVGQTTWDELYVLIPADAKVTPNFGNSQVNCDTFPTVEGEVIKVGRDDIGPWWDILREDLPKMEQELREHLYGARVKKDEEDSKKAIEHAERMEQAKQSISSWKAK